MHERSLWRDVENTRQIDGVVLAGMISPTIFGGSLLPVGCIRVLRVDLDYVSLSGLLGSWIGLVADSLSWLLLLRLDFFLGGGMIKTA